MKEAERLGAEEEVRRARKSVARVQDREAARGGGEGIGKWVCERRN